jgi:formyltetrahydrofolate-dependent phosphoribosylglycinamide formyltransferase
VTARLAVLVSGNGTNLQAILDACACGELDATVVAVVSNRSNAYALARAEEANVPTAYHPLKWYLNTGRTRDEYDAALADLIAPYQPDWVILAGWMHVLGMAFLEHYPSRVVNIHPALPGQFPGTNSIVRAFEAYQQGEISETGIMVHLVPDMGVDNGPTLATVSVPILPDDTLETLETRMHEAEHELLVNTLRALISREKTNS